VFLLAFRGPARAGAAAVHGVDSATVHVVISLPPGKSFALAERFAGLPLTSGFFVYRAWALRRSTATGAPIVLLRDR
jgi:hypothetical protein